MDFIDFFSGIGGFRIGMELAGHKCKGHCEIDKFADKSYRVMHEIKENEWYAKDIKQVKYEELPDADCYCGGFPCQAFSVAGKRRGFEDMRGTLIFEILRLAEYKKPRILFFENVKGLLNHDGGRTFTTILCAMDELGYDAEWQCINSSSYVPQNRERVYIIGHLRGSSGRKVFPITTGNGEALKQIIGGPQAERIYNVTGSSCTLSSRGGGLGAKTGLYYIQNGINVGYKSDPAYTDIASCLLTRDCKGIGNQAMTAVEVIPVLTPNRINKRQNGRRFKAAGEPMFTLTAQDRHGILIKPAAEDISKGRIRRLTPKECFRLQGYSDEYYYKAAAVNSDTQLYRQIGNSVTVPVIYEIARRLE